MKHYYFRYFEYKPNEILISAIIITLRQKSINLALVAICRIIIMSAALWISYELWNVYTIARARWYVAGKEWNIDKVKIKIITFFIKPNWKFIATVYHKSAIRVICGSLRHEPSLSRTYGVINSAYLCGDQVIASLCLPREFFENHLYLPKMLLLTQIIPLHCWFHGPRIISAASNLFFWTFFRARTCCIQLYRWRNHSIEFYFHRSPRYQITQSLSTNKQMYRHLLSKMGIPFAPTHL